MIAVALVILTLFIYLQTCRHPFTGIDDESYVTANIKVKRGLSAEGLRWALTATSNYNWHPLTWLSHMTDVSLFGVRPGPMHMTNVVVHLANTLLLLGFFIAATGNPLRSGFVAAIFALHPLHVESVAWISERKDVLSTLFGLLALHGYLRYCRSPRLSTYLPVPLLHAASLAAKPMLVTLPLLLLLLDWWPLGRLGAPAQRSPETPPRRRLLLEKIPLLALSLGGGLLALLTQSQGHSLSGWEHVTLAVRAANAAISTATYTIKTVFPHSLSIFYPHPGRGIDAGLAAAAATLLAVLSVGALLQRRRRPAALAGWIWFLIGLAPVIGLIQTGRQAMADRYAYLPQTGLVIVVAWGLSRAAVPRLRRAAVLAGVAAVAACTVLAFRQTRLWRSDFELFGQAVENSPGNYFAHEAIGRAHLLAGSPREAAVEFREALRIKPDYSLARYNLGVVIEQLGDPGEAQRQYEEAIRSDPRNTYALTNLGTLLHRQGRHTEAAARYRQALSLNPDDAVAWVNLGLLDFAARNYAQAEAAFLAALRSDPSSQLAAEGLARVRAATR